MVPPGACGDTPRVDPKAVLLRHFGYPDFRPGQEALVRTVLSGSDALGILPTGGGKSVCYQVPAHLLPGLTIVVSPLISLMADQVDRARAAGLSAALLNSTQPADERAHVLEEARRGALRLLLLAPERLETASFREALREIRVSLVAVDEAHCIAEWGQDFRPSYLRIGRLRDALDAPVLALTATATPRVREEIVRSLRLRDPVRVVGSFDRPNLSWHVLRVRDDRERHASLASLVRGARAPVVVYAGTRKMVEALRDRLAAFGLPAEAYHAGLAAEERARVQAAFMSGERRIVVATNAFGMGVDKADVRRVVHWQLPGTLEAYYQEAGRAGRDGDPASCVALHHPSDARLHRAFIARSRPAPAELRRVLRTVERRIPAGEKGTIEVHALVRDLGRGWSDEAVEGALAALVAAGALRRMAGSVEARGRPAGAEAPPPTLTLGVHARVRDPERAATLRRAALDKLAGVERYARARGCRRRALLAYFGEGDAPERCESCDRCLGRDNPVLRSLGPTSRMRGALLERLALLGASRIG
jgi:ATP-dependent DNA helicase RecQ